MGNKYLASMTILVKDRQNHSLKINQILTENGHLIIARFGINLQKRCLEKCPALITIIIEGTRKEIEKLEKQLEFANNQVKINIFEE